MKLTSFSTHFDSGRRNAFTLAEVLITLGIIGVVAAMTMPTLMNQTNGAQYRTAYKKALSAISQAVTLNVALDEWNFADTTAGTTGQSIYTMLNNRMNVVRKETNGLADYKYLVGSTATTLNSNYTLFFNDGIMFSFEPGAAKCTDDSTVGTVNKCKGLIDVNGIKPPNKQVKCEGSTTGSSCEVKNPTDVYPVLFYDQTIVPSSDAARAVLYSK